MRYFATLARGLIGLGQSRRRGPGRFLWLVAVFGILAWGARQRFSLPLEPLADDDYYGYLNPALSKLTGGGFDHSIGREFLYPVFVFLNLCLFGDFRAIAISQHLLGLLTLPVLLLAWRELLALRRAPSAQSSGERTFLVAAARQAPALIMSWVYLCTRATILAEHTIRPEAVFPFAAALSLWLNLRFIRLRWVDSQPVAAWKVGAIHLFVSAVLFMLRPSCAFALIFINLPLAVALCARGGGRAAKLWPIFWALAAALLLLFLPEHVLRQQDRLAATLLPSMRLLVHANLVLRQIDDDLRLNRPTPYDPVMLRAFRDRLAHAVDASEQPENHPWIKLGFNPDYIYLKEAVFEPFFPGADKRADHALAGFCNCYCLRTALHQPLAMSGKVLRQLTFFYSFDPLIKFVKNNSRSTGRQKYWGARLQLNDDSLYPRAVQCFAFPPFRRLLDFSVSGGLYLRRCERLARSTKPVPQSAIVQWIAAGLNAAYFPLLIAGLVACAAVLRPGAPHDALRLNAWATLLLFSYNFGTSLTIATAFYLGQMRYIQMQSAFTLFSEFAGLYFLGRWAAARWRRRGVAQRKIPPADGPAGAVRPATNPA